MSEKIEEYIARALPFVASGTGAVVSASMAGADMGLVGALVTPLLQTFGDRIIADIPERAYSGIEKQKTAACLISAAERIQYHINKGLRPRKDNLMGKKINDYRPVIEDIFEGIIIKTRDEHELKKIVHYGVMLANIAFDENISENEALWCTYVMNKISYKQIILMEALRNKNNLNKNFRNSGYDDGNVSLKVSFLAQQIYDLVGMGIVAQNLVERTDDSGFIGSSISNNKGYLSLLDWHDIIPDDLVLTEIGERISNLIDTSIVNKQDVDDVVGDLSC